MNRLNKFYEWWEVGEREGGGGERKRKGGRGEREGERERKREREKRGEERWNANCSYLHFIDQYKTITINFRHVSLPCPPNKHNKFVPLSYG